MQLGSGRALGKIILFGEHAAVYGRPALAVPVAQVFAEATVELAAPGSGLVICAADLGEQIALADAPTDHPLAAAVRLALAHRVFAGAGLPTVPSGPDWLVTVRSTIPIASGMGSGAAVSAAIVRAIGAAAKSERRISESANGESANQRSTHPERSAAQSKDAVRILSGAQRSRRTQYPLTPAEVSALVYEVEKLHHGTPSGIDNTVIAYEQPVYFVRGRPPQPFPIGRPFTLIIADSGIASPTKIAVGDVRRAWEREPQRFEALFDRIAAVVEAARAAIAEGEPEKLGPLMDENHALLQEIGVSCPELDALVGAARSAGALGAKLSGGGRGGNIIALVAPATQHAVSAALQAAGAVRVIVTQVGEPASR